MTIIDCVNEVYNCRALYTAPQNDIKVLILIPCHGLLYHICRIDCRKRYHFADLACILKPHGRTALQQTNYVKQYLGTLKF